MIFPEIDTSYWQLDDKQWVEARKAQWLTIEPMFQGGAHKSKKALTIIKRYFLKGIMPDFEKLKDWQSVERHLDLFCFLWLHPSWDKAVLTELRNSYVSYGFTQKEDVENGVNILFGYAAIRASQPYDDDSDVLQAQGHNELLFDVIIGNITQEHIPEVGRDDWSYIKRKLDVAYINEMSRWLCNDRLIPINEDCLYQYDNYLEYWYQSCPDRDDFYENPDNLGPLPYTKNGLFRIAQFDIDKEGDTCRTRFVLKMRNILDEREFIPAIKQMWQEAKAGTIETIKPWGKKRKA